MWFGRVGRKEEEEKGNWMEMDAEYKKEGAGPRAKSKEQRQTWLEVVMSDMNQLGL